MFQSIAFFLTDSQRGLILRAIHSNFIFIILKFNMKHRTIWDSHNVIGNKNNYILSFLSDSPWLRKVRWEKLKYPPFFILTFTFNIFRNDDKSGIQTPSTTLLLAQRRKQSVLSFDNSRIVLTEDEKFDFVKTSVSWIEGEDIMDKCFVLNFGYNAPVPWPQVGNLNNIL